MRALFPATRLVWLAPFCLIWLAPSCAWAKPRVSSGASARGPAPAGPRPAASALPASQECLQLALNGRFEGECASDHESDKCVGLRLALRNSLKREECRVRAGEGCLEYSYRQHTQAEWMAVASGYLAEFGQCVKNQYGGDSSNGFREALADPNFRAKLREFEDGAAALGLRNGEILERMLDEETLGSILKTAPAWRFFDARLKDRLQAAADSPAPVTEGIETPKGESGATHPRMASGWNQVGGGYEAPLAGGTAARPAERNGAEWKLNASGIEEIARHPASAGDGEIFVRNVKANPYSLGLDLNLFDRVSLTYQKRFPEMRGVNDYVKSLPRREPKTVRDLLERNKEMEL